MKLTTLATILMLTILTSCLQDEKTISISTKPNSEAGAGGGAGGNDPGDNDAAPSVVIPTYNNNLAWVTQLGAVTSTPGGDTSQEDECYSVTTDSDGNVYCAGYTTGSLGETNGGGYDAFVMKLNSSGVVQWIRQLGATSVPGGNTSSWDYCLDVTVDDIGNVYCAGKTGGYLGEMNGGGDDVFVMKLNSSGIIQWITQLGATTQASGGSNSSSDNCYGVAVDNAGNVYCTGHTLGSLGEPNAGNYDGFVLKLDSAGSLVWLTQLGSSTTYSGGSNSSTDMFSDIAVDNDGGVYIAGKTRSSIGETNGGSGGYDAVVVKFNSNTGALEWVTQLGSSTVPSGGSTTGSEACNSIAVDINKNVFCAGSASGSFSETSAGSSDAFVMKINSTGGLEWVTQLGSTTAPSATGNDYAMGIAVDKDGNIYSSGYTESSLGETFSGVYDVFLMKLDTSGAITWIKQLGDTTKAIGGDNSGNDICNGVSVDSSGNVYCAGSTNGGMSENNGGLVDAFVVKLE